MNIAIIGSGNVGSALGKGWIHAGHKVVFGVRDSVSSKIQKARELLPNAIFRQIEDACRPAEVIVITTPPDAVIELIPKMGNVTQKIVIDTTNAFRVKPEGYPTAFHALKERGGCEKIVKCFNSTGFENMLNPSYTSHAIDMFCAGNSTEAKEVAIKLAKDLGFGECYDFGGDGLVELLEEFAKIWINLAIVQGIGRNVGFKLIHR